MLKMWLSTVLNKESKLNWELLNIELFSRLNSKDNIQKLEKVFDLSIGGIDIESYNHVIEKKNLENVSKIEEPNKILSIQEMSLIGYGDHFESQNFHYHLFKIENRYNVSQIKRYTKL